MRSSRSRYAFLFAGFLFLPTILAFGQATPDPWLLLANSEQGSINTHTTREDLVRAYGAANVVDGDIGVGEGDTEPGTYVFPKDAQRSIQILWKDPDKKTAPRLATISGKASRWHGVHGLSLGTSLSELERLNGRRFDITWGTDEPGWVISWKGGLLEKEFKGVNVWLDDLPPKAVTTPHRPGPHAPDRHVNQINWEF